MPVEVWNGKWWNYTRVIVLTVGPLKFAGRIAWRAAPPETPKEAR